VLEADLGDGRGAAREREALAEAELQMRLAIAGHEAGRAPEEPALPALPRRLQLEPELGAGAEGEAAVEAGADLEAGVGERVERERALGGSVGETQAASGSPDEAAIEIAVALGKEARAQPRLEPPGERAEHVVARRLRLELDQHELFEPHATAGRKDAHARVEHGDRGVGGESGVRVEEPVEARPHAQLEEPLVVLDARAERHERGAVPLVGPQRRSRRLRRPAGAGPTARGEQLVGALAGDLLAEVAL